MTLDLQRLERHLRDVGPVALTYDDVSGQFFVASDSLEEGVAGYGAKESLLDAFGAFFLDVSGAEISEQPNECPKPWITQCRRALRHEAGRYCNHLCYDALNASIQHRISTNG